MNGNLLFADEKEKPVNGEQIIPVNKELSNNFISGKTPDFSQNACSFAMRFRILEKGGPVEHALSNLGMLFSVASGYSDGIRAWYSWNEQKVCFEIGRVKEKSSIGIFKSGVSPYLLHDLVCTYDGKKMCLYVDGELGAEAHYSGKLDGKNAPIKVGFGGYGIGYNRMFVDQLEYYPRVLTKEEITRRMNAFPPEDREQQKLFKDFSPLSCYGAIPLEIDSSLIEKSLKLIEQYDKNSVFSNDFQFMLFQRFMHQKNYQKAAPILLKETKDLLASEEPDPNSEELANKRISRFFAVWESLQTLDQKVHESSEYKDLINQLAKKFPSEIKLYEKIALLESKMLDRVRKLEKDAIQEFQTTSQAANKGTTILYLAPNGSDQGTGSQKSLLAPCDMLWRKPQKRLVREKISFFPLQRERISAIKRLFLKICRTPVPCSSKEIPIILPSLRERRF